MRPRTIQEKKHGLLTPGKMVSKIGIATVLACLISLSAGVEYYCQCTNLTIFSHVIYNMQHDIYAPCEVAEPDSQRCITIKGHSSRFGELTLRENNEPYGLEMCNTTFNTATDPDFHILARIFDYGNTTCCNSNHCNSAPTDALKLLQLI